MTRIVLKLVSALVTFKQGCSQPRSALLNPTVDFSLKSDNLLTSLSKVFQASARRIYVTHLCAKVHLYSSEPTPSYLLGNQLLGSAEGRGLDNGARSSSRLVLDQMRAEGRECQRDTGRDKKESYSRVRSQVSFKITCKSQAFKEKMCT